MRSRGLLRLISIWRCRQQLSVDERIGFLSGFSHFIGVCGHDDGSVQLGVHLLKERGYGSRVGGIQLSCRFIGEKEGGLVDECTADGHPCLFSSRQMGDRAVFEM